MNKKCFTVALFHIPESRAINIATTTTTTLATARRPAAPDVGAGVGTGGAGVAPVVNVTEFAAAVRHQFAGSRCGSLHQQSLNTAAVVEHAGVTLPGAPEAVRFTRVLAISVGRKC